MSLARGSVLAGRYRLVGLLGEGGMGDVWEATNTVTGRGVAIKRLRATASSRTAAGRARFMLEAQAACAVDHPNVVEVLDFIDSEEEPPIIVMELLRGKTLADRLEGGQALAVEESARLLLPVVSAVGAAHARGIVHRDLKPANVFLHEEHGEFRVKVLDFGIAKWLGAEAASGALKTETGSTLGTPSYMAPEQALGERAIDHRADVWALGVILYECLSGMRPVEGENAASMVVRLLSTGIMPLERLVPGCPTELAELVMRMLSRDAGRRPTSLGEVQRVLGRLTSVVVPDFGEPQVAAAPPTSDGSRPSGSTLPALASSFEPRTRPGRSAVPVAVALGAAALVAAGWGLRAASHHEASGAERVAERRSAMEPRPADRTALAAHDGPSATVVPEPTAMLGATSALATAASGTAPLAPAAGSASVDAQASASPAKRSGRRAAAANSASAPAPAAAGLPPGAACERSRECASGLCLAYSCK